MQRYIVRRLLQAVVTLFLVSVIVFILGRLTGDPVALLLTEYSTLEDKELLTKQLGLDKPLPEQYAIFIGNALRGDLGRSIRGERAPALELVLERLPATVKLAAIAVLVSFLIGLPLGVITAENIGSTGAGSSCFLAGDCGNVCFQCSTWLVADFRIWEARAIRPACLYDELFHGSCLSAFNPFWHVGSSR